MEESGGKAPAEQLEVVKKREVEKRTKRDSEQNEVQRDGEAVIERALWAKWERQRSSCDHKTAGGRRHQGPADGGGFRCSACGVRGIRRSGTNQ